MAGVRKGGYTTYRPLSWFKLSSSPSTQRSEATCPRSHSGQVAEPEPAYSRACRRFRPASLWPSARLLRASGPQQVFIAKVLKRLFPPDVGSSSINVPSDPPQTSVENPTSKSKQEPEKPPPSTEGDGEIPPCRRFYTASPPPEGYVADPLECANFEKSENSGSSEDPEEDDPSGQPKRRRTRKKKPRSRVLNPSVAGGEQTEFEKHGNLTRDKSQSQHTDGPRISRNKKRKLKKKRQKERKRAAGLLTKATGVDFMYQPEERGSEEDFEDTDEMADGILDFLQATQEIYFSDRKSACADWSVCSETLQKVLKRLESHCMPSPDVTLLHQMKSLVLLRDTERLTSALDQFQEHCLMPPHESKVISTLFHYWMTEILPVKNRN
ncbi:glutamate-rich protein 1 [Tachyglossus aculeatus]|uniref:glutamate-rich protein 1 n=1 Tax=Tachyglossus aculeatus TaxID=9261 RepID=UPI0018F4DDFB|nr:glutamate-rich protein 1 [Tachyglossus aculeatus]